MSVAHVRSVAFHGFDCKPIDVQVHITQGLPTFAIVGLADKSVAESKERLRSALSSMGLSLPASRIIVNLSPADYPKEGSHFDLPIALALLIAMGVLPQEDLLTFIALGEVSLDSHLVPVAGVLAAATHAINHNLGLICPYGQGGEASWIDGLLTLAPRSLLDIVHHFSGAAILPKPPPFPIASESYAPAVDLLDIKGQETAKRALEIAASGGHHLLMVGPPGSGKSMLATALTGLLPPMNSAQSLAVSIIYSIAGQLHAHSLIHKRPFRSPHHSTSMAALVGGGRRANPGEITLAHQGVLFLDELPEFQRSVLDSLRQPLETGMVSVARANAHVDYPAQFQLVAAMNPCRCGYLDDANRACTKAPRCGSLYLEKISGPLLDRFDLHVHVPLISPTVFRQTSSLESSSLVRQRVIATHAIQQERYQSLSITTNAQASGRLLEQVAPLTPTAQKLLDRATETFRLTGRGYHRALKVARTIADMDKQSVINDVHMAEAIHFKTHFSGASRG